MDPNFPTVISIAIFLVFTLNSTTLTPLQSSYFSGESFRFQQAIQNSYSFVCVARILSSEFFRAIPIFLVILIGLK